MTSHLLRPTGPITDNGRLLRTRLLGRRINTTLNISDPAFLKLFLYQILAPSTLMNVPFSLPEFRPIVQEFLNNPDHPAFNYKPSLPADFPIIRVDKTTVPQLKKVIEKFNKLIKIAIFPGFPGGDDVHYALGFSGNKPALQRKVRMIYGQAQSAFDYAMELILHKHFVNLLPESAIIHIPPTIPSVIPTFDELLKQLPIRHEPWERVADDNDEVRVVSEGKPSIRDPISYSVIKTPVRGVICGHIVDLFWLLDINKQKEESRNALLARGCSRAAAKLVLWECPIQGCSQKLDILNNGVFTDLHFMHYIINTVNEKLRSQKSAAHRVITSDGGSSDDDNDVVLQQDLDKRLCELIDIDEQRKSELYKQQKRVHHFQLEMNEEAEAQKKSEESVEINQLQQTQQSEDHNDDDESREEDLVKQWQDQQNEQRPAQTIVDTVPLSQIPWTTKIRNPMQLFGEAFPLLPEPASIVPLQPTSNVRMHYKQRKLQPHKRTPITNPTEQELLDWGEMTGHIEVWEKDELNQIGEINLHLYLVPCYQASLSAPAGSRTAIYRTESLPPPPPPQQQPTPKRKSFVEQLVQLTNIGSLTFQTKRVKRAPSEIPYRTETVDGVDWVVLLD